MSPSPNKPVTIYGVPFSVHTRKVILAARLKGIIYSVVPIAPVIPGSPPPNWRTISPTGLIPAIDDNGFTLADSTAIVQYFERLVPEPALLPAETTHYARALALDAWAGGFFREVVHPLFHQQVVGPKVHGAASDEAVVNAVLNRNFPQNCQYLESEITGRFLVGERLSVADLALVSNLIVLRYLGHHLDRAKFPRLTMYLDAQLEARPFSDALRDERPFVEEMGLDCSFLPLKA